MTASTFQAVPPEIWIDICARYLAERKVGRSDKARRLLAHAIHTEACDRAPFDAAEDEIASWQRALKS